MQTLRYLNLLNNTAKIRIKKCFIYNNTIIFAVPLQFVSQAIGPKGKHVRALQEKLEKKIKIIGDANGIEDVNKFIKQIVEPVSFVSIDVNENEIVINAGSRNKAALIGRHKRRYNELNQILEDNFGKELRIV